VRRVQKMMNDRPKHGGRQTASEALFGAPNLHPMQPPTEIIANLLQLGR
jgi:hypothetical protein